MPYSLSDEGEVVSDANGVSWADAVKQQRAYLSNESRVASMYAELDERPKEVLPDPPVKEEPKSEMVKVVVGNESDPALTASLVQALENISQRQQITEQALIAALHQIQSPVVNVEAPNVNVEPAAITVEQPDITVQAPEVTVEAPNVTVKSPTIEVHPEIHMPDTSGQKTVTFVRDPLTQRVESAEITE